VDNLGPQPGSLQPRPVPEGDSRAANGTTDAQLKEMKFKKEPWFAKVPPELRKAIQANARHRAPRGYEERLRRYFESID